MTHPWLIVFGGLLAGVAAYDGAYLVETSPVRALAGSKQPALAWMQQEYHLNDGQFARLCTLHDAYRPKCLEMCRKIDAKNAELKKMLAAANGTITPEIERTLAEAAQIRAECQAGMLEHFSQVAQTMPPEQGRRYLQWVWQETLAARPMLPGEAPEQTSPQIR